MDYFPALPEVPPDQVANGECGIRYEDISQDGRLMLLALPHSIGDVVWRKLMVHHAVTRAAHAGVLPILTRFIIEGGGGPVSVRWPLSGTGVYQMSHTVDATGSVDRILLNMWTSMTGPRGRTNGPPPPGAGEPVYVGRVFAEHVLTRLFAPPGERKVLTFDGGVPSTRWSWRAPDEVLAVPADAEALDELAPDSAPVIFGINHTDSNQHVNSLVYPRLFQDAALRRFAALGRDTRLLPSRLEIAYRKPCFAGDRAQIVLRAYVAGEQLGAVGAFISESAPLDRPHCTIQVRFTR